MLNLTRVIDRATGYVYVQPTSSAPPGAVDASSASRSHRPNEYALFSTAAGPLTGIRSDVQDVQERWIDAREQWDAFERREWRREGENARAEDARREAEGHKSIRIRGVKDASHKT